MKRFYQYRLFVFLSAIAVFNGTWASTASMREPEQQINSHIPVENVTFYFDESGQKSVQQILRMPFKDTISSNHKINTENSGKGAFWLNIRLSEVKNTKGELIFYAGQHFKTELFCIENDGRFRKFSGNAPRFEGHVLCKDLIAFTINPAIDDFLLIHIIPYRFNPFPIHPQLYIPDSINPDSLIPDLQFVYKYRWFNFVTYGAFTIILAFFLFKYFVLKSPEYPAYIAYLACLLMTGVNDWITTTAPGSVHLDLMHLFYVTLSLVTYCFYVAFSSKLLNLNIHLPGLNQWIRRIQMFLIMYAVFDLVLFYVLRQIDNMNAAFQVFRFILIIVSILIIARAFRLKDKVSRFFITGSTFYIIGGLLYLIFYYLYFHDPLPENLFTYPPFYYRTGAMIEILFFSLGLAYKSHLSEKEHTMLLVRMEQEKMQRESEYEDTRRKTIEDERNRLSRDLHDEVGMGLTRIRYLIEMLKRNKKEIDELEIEPIARESTNVIMTMHDIVWSLKTGEHSLEEFLAHLRGTVIEYLETYGIQLDYKITGDLKSVYLTPLQKRNVFLVIRESLHNIVRHSNASKVSLGLLLDNGLTLMIEDDGIGVGNEVRHGNGITNMQKRIEECGGRFEWSNRLEKGVSILVEIKN